MVAHSIPTRKPALPPLTRATPAGTGTEGRGWIGAVAVFLLATAVAMAMLGGSGRVDRPGDPLSLPEQSRTMIMVPLGR